MILSSLASHLYISSFEFQELLCVHLQKHVLDLVKHLRLTFLREQIKTLNVANYFCRKYHHGCLKGSYSYTDSWKPPIHVSDWLIFCCGNLILHQKHIKVLRNIFLWTHPTDPWCNMLQTLERRRKYIGVILSDEHTRLWLHLWLFHHISYTNQFIDFQGKSVNWFLYDRDPS